MSLKLKSRNDQKRMDSARTHFFGVSCETGKKYSQVVSQTFHVTMAALEPSSSPVEDPYVSLMLSRNGKEYLLCSLKHDSIMQVNLDLVFDKGENVTFYLSGRGTVHLSGYEILNRYSGEFSSNITSRGRHLPFSVGDINSNPKLPNKVSHKIHENSVELRGDSPSEVDLTRKVLGRQLESLAKDARNMPSTSKGFPRQEKVITIPDEEDSLEVVPGGSGQGVAVQGLLSKGLVKALTTEIDDGDDDEEEDEDFNVLDAEEEENSEDDDDDDEEDDDDDDSDEDDEITAREAQKRKLELESSARKRAREDSSAPGTSNSEIPDNPVEIFEVDDRDEDTSDDDDSVEEMDSVVEKTPKKSNSKQSLSVEEQSSSEKKSMLSQKKLQQSLPFDEHSPEKNSELSQKKKKSEKNKSLDGKHLGKESKKKPINALEIKDIRPGYGPPAKKGKMLTVFYTGRLPDGTVFDQSEAGKPLTFKLGGGEVIKGWDIGLEGMKVGGKRRLRVPADMAYGYRKLGNQPKDTPVIYVVELKSIT